MVNENDSDLSSVSPTKDGENKENMCFKIPRKMQRKTVKVLDVSDSSKAKFAQATSLSPL